MCFWEEFIYISTWQNFGMQAKLTSWSFTHIYSLYILPNIFFRAILHWSLSVFQKRPLFWRKRLKRLTMASVLVKIVGSLSSSPLQGKRYVYKRIENLTALWEPAINESWLPHCNIIATLRLTSPSDIVANQKRTGSWNKRFFRFIRYAFEWKTIFVNS